jgi:hypothetical protein
MTILIYKRTHRGDPDADGVFGIHDCMGSVRDFAYDAVVGVGGIGDDARAHGIAGKINWIGVGPGRFPRLVAAAQSWCSFTFFSTTPADRISFMSRPRLGSESTTTIFACCSTTLLRQNAGRQRDS